MITTPRHPSVPPAPEPPIPVFDGHNDTLLSLARTGRSFFEESGQGHVDLPRARAGGLAGGFFAVFVPDPDPTAAIPSPDDPPAGAAPSLDPAAAVARYGDPATIPPPMPLEHAQREAMRMVAALLRLVTESAGAARLVRSASDIRECLADGTFAVELHFEGAEPIDPDLDALEVFHRAGLRSLGLVWSRPNRFAHGVPFGFPASPDTGPGLTDRGRQLVRACNRLRIAIDCSHLNERGFWDVAALTDAPLVASHSNAHALAPSSRNLTDKQLDAVRDSGGLVGLNFHVGFLRSDGRADPNTPLSLLADHLDHLIGRLGPDKVALGSDFDGATMPLALNDAAALPRLFAALRARGYDDPTLHAIAHGNWLRVLEQTWGA